MNDIANEMLKLKLKLEAENKEELLKLIASYKAEVKMKDIEVQIDQYIEEYDKLLSKSKVKSELTAN